MKKIVLFLVINLLCGYNVFCQKSLKNDSIYHVKGYLLFVKMNDFEETIFLPKYNASKSYTFKKLSQIKGYLLRGQNTYEMYKAQQKAKKTEIFIPVMNNVDSSFNAVPAQLRIAVVELTYYKTSPGKPKEDSGMPFDYKRQRYVIYYVDDWDVAIKNVKNLKK